MKESFGLQALREGMGLRTMDVAVALGISDATVRNWEKGRSIPSLSPTGYSQILKLYSCTPDELDKAYQETTKQTGTSNS